MSNSDDIPADAVDHHDDDEEVGYRRPPRRSRFKPGMSGNPRGRPKGRQSAAEKLEALLAERVTLHIDGKVKRVPLDEVLMRSLIKKAAAGDVQSIRLIEDIRATRPAAELEFTGIDDEADNQLIEAVFARWNEGKEV